MKYLQLYTVFLLIGSSLLQIQSLPIESHPHQVADVSLPEYIKSDLPASTHNPQESMPLTLMDAEEADKSSANTKEEHQSRSRRFIMGGLGNFGGLGGKFSGLGLGLNGFGGLGHWGLGGLNGLGGYKPLFGKFFG